MPFWPAGMRCRTIETARIHRAARPLGGRVVARLAGVGAVMTVGKEFAFEVGLLARVRVRAANESSARQVVPQCDWRAGRARDRAGQ